MSWKVCLDIEPIAQRDTDTCGPASVQMILSTMGRRGLGEEIQLFFKSRVNFYKGPWQFGSPVGVACTINRFNCGPNPIAKPAPPAREYRLARTVTPYDAAATLVDALCRYEAASAVMVFGSTHWIVVFGAEGEGDPINGPSYSIESLWICNPSDRRTGPETGVRLRIPYAKFLTEMFDGCNDDRSARNDPLREYGDGAEFVIVTDARAKPAATLQLPPAEIPVFPKPATTLANAVNALTELHSGFAGVPAEAPHEVKLLGDEGGSYYLVPFVKDDQVNLVRLDADGTYLGTAFDVGNTRLFSAAPPTLGKTDSAVGNAVGDVAGGAADVNAPSTAEELVWAPSLQSASPFSPLLQQDTGGTKRYVPITGEGNWGALENRLTKDPIT